MATRTLLFLCTLGALLSLGWYFYPRGRAVADEHIEGDSTWHPNAEEIARQVGNGPIGAFDDERHLKFAALFKQRYRDKSQAIGVKFITEDRVKAMFAPIIPRWDMARVGVELLNESRAVFGRDYQVDIYETYITAPMRKLAEVTADPTDSRALVKFDPKFATERPADLLEAEIKAHMPGIPGIFWPSSEPRQAARTNRPRRTFGSGSIHLPPIGMAGTS